MKRRTLLGTVGATVALTGCLADGSDDAGDGGEDGTPTTAGGETPTGTPTSPNDGTPTPGTDSPGPNDEPGSTDPGATTGEFVRELFAVPQLVAPNSPDSFGVHGDRDEQFVVAALDGQGGGPAVDEISLVVGGESHAVEREIGYGSWALFDYEGAYDPADHPRGWVVVTLPNPLAADSVALTWPGGEASLAAAERAELAREPTTFEVQSFDAPDAVDVGETARATATIANTGDTDGVFVAAVNRSGPRIAYAPEGAVRLSIPAGETATWEYEHTVDWDDMSEDRPMRVHLVRRDDSSSREITVRATGTATESE